MRPSVLALYFVVLLAGAAALATAAPAASPLIPKSAVYAGKNSQSKPIKIFVSKQGKRIGYTIHVKLECANGSSFPTYWTTEGRFYKDYWIRPKQNGTFSLKSHNELTDENDSIYKARAEINGRFVSSKLVTGRFRGHMDSFYSDGTPFTQCDTGAVSWSAKRTK